MDELYSYLLDNNTTKQLDSILKSYGEDPKLYRVKSEKVNALIDLGYVPDSYAGALPPALAPEPELAREGEAAAGGAAEASETLGARASRIAGNTAAAAAEYASELLKGAISTAPIEGKEGREKAASAREEELRIRTGVETSAALGDTQASASGDYVTSREKKLSLLTKDVLQGKDTRDDFVEFVVEGLIDCLHQNGSFDPVCIRHLINQEVR
jgi:hypothetical protein